MKKIIITVLALLFFAFPLFAKIVEYPNASCLVLLDSTSISLNKDSEVTKERYLRIEILQKRGRSVYGDIKERFDKDDQVFEILKAQTITPSGEIITPKDDAISVVSAPEVAFATQYTNLQMQVVTFPALEKGAIIEYCYRITSTQPLKNPMFGLIIFQETEPIKKKIVTINFPKEQKPSFHYEFIGDEVEPVIKNLGSEMVSYSFLMEDISKIGSEPYMPAIADISPKLCYTFYPDWNTFCKWYGKNFFKSAKPSGALKKYANELGGNTIDEQIKKIVLFIQQKVRNVYLSFGESGYKPNKAKEILHNMYGDSQDKAVLLVALLKAIDVDAYPVLVASQDSVDIENSLPVPSIFKHILVAIGNDEKRWYVSPTGQFCKYRWLPASLQGRDAILLTKKGENYVHIPIFDPSASNCDVSLVADIDEKGNMNGTFELTATGYCDRQVRNQLKQKNKEEQDIFFKTVVNSVLGGSKVISYNFTNPEDLTRDMKLKAVFESPNYVTFQGDKIRFNIPRLSINGANIGNYCAAKERDYGLLLQSARKYTYNARITIPEEYTAEYTPRAGCIDLGIAQYDINSYLENEVVYFNSYFNLKERDVPVLKYDQFKQKQDEYFNRNNWMVILEK